MKDRAKFVAQIRETLINRKQEMDEALSKQSHEKLTDGVVQDSADEALSLSMEKLQKQIPLQSIITTDCIYWFNASKGRS